MSFGNTVQNVGNFAQDLPSSENVLHEDIFVPPFYQWVPELGPRPLVLDIQCRKGHFTHEMAEWLKCGNPDIQMVGIDSDYQNVQFARCKYPDLSFHQGYFLQDHYPSGSQLWQSVSYQCFCFQHCLDSFTNDEILFFWDKIHLYRSKSAPTFIIIRETIFPFHSLQERIESVHLRFNAYPLLHQILQHPITREIFIIYKIA